VQQFNFVLNIGLMSDLDGPITNERAIAALVNHDIRIERDVVLNSDTEPTLVAVVTMYDLPFLCWQKLHGVANELHQDCIAAYNVQSLKGALIGPRAEKWGDFNPAYFFMPDGSRLGATLPAAA
jgi:hypothetical protein